MCDDDIPDEEGLLRRIPPWHPPQEIQNPGEGEAPSVRPSSAAFNIAKDETGLSFHLESSLRQAGEPLTYQCPIDTPGWAVARITAGQIRALGLTIRRDDQPHHVEVMGLAALNGSERRKMARELAKKAVYVVLPRVL